MKTLRLVLLFLCMAATPAFARAQSDAQKMKEAKMILTDDDYYAVERTFNANRLAYSQSELVDKVKKDLFNTEIVDLRRNNGKSAYEWDRWVYVIKSISYMDADGETLHVLAYISEDDILNFGASDSKPKEDATPTPTVTHTPESSPRADNSVQEEPPANTAPTVTTPTAPAPQPRQFNLPIGRRLSGSEDMVRNARKLYDNPDMSFGDAVTMLYAARDDYQLKAVDMVEEGKPLPTNCVIIQFDESMNISRLIGHCTDGEYYDLRTGQYINSKRLEGESMMYFE